MRLIYAADTIEGFSCQLRETAMSWIVFPTDDSPLKMLYLAMIDTAQQWTGYRQDWGQIHAHLEIFFEEHPAGHKCQVFLIEKALLPPVPKQGIPQKIRRNEFPYTSY